MPTKKKFTTAEGAVDKFFTVPPYGTSADISASKPAVKKKKRAERFLLLLDGQLKEDLTLLSKALNSKSINDLLVTVLAEFVERRENQTKLERYRKLLEG